MRTFAEAYLGPPQNLGWSTLWQKLTTFVTKGSILNFTVVTDTPLIRHNYELLSALLKLLDVEGCPTDEIPLWGWVAEWLCVENYLRVRFGENRYVMRSVKKNN